MTTADRAKLLEGLRPYVTHWQTCDPIGRGCTCGLAALVNALDAEDEATADPCPSCGSTDPDRNIVRFGDDHATVRPWSYRQLLVATERVEQAYRLLYEVYLPSLRRADPRLYAVCGRLESLTREAEGVGGELRRWSEELELRLTEEPAVQPDAREEGRDE